jgi:anaerobic selenocysteine-containing dehydrogenase
MLTRRKFLKIFGLTGLAVSVLPSFLVKRSFSSSGDDSGTNPTVRNWLYGSAHRGCSSPDLAFEYHGKLEDGLKDLASYRLPSPARIDFV